MPEGCVCGKEWTAGYDGIFVMIHQELQARMQN